METKNKLKIRLVEIIEEELEIKLTVQQMQFIFSEYKLLVMTAPRRYGKDLITAIKIAVRAIMNPNVKIGVICPTNISKRMLYEQVLNMLNILINATDLTAIDMTRVNPAYIKTTSDTEIFFFSCIEDEYYVLRGYKFNEVHVMEASYYKDGDYLLALLHASLMIIENLLLHVIGTPSMIDDNLMRIIMNFDDSEIIAVNRQ